jgi:1-pyrroline-5-carboxylate dehydrogenase
MGAVIDEKAFGKISEYIEIGKKEGRLVLGGETAGSEQSGGYFIPPTIIADVEPDAPSRRRRSSAPCSPSSARGLRSRDGDRQQHRVRPDGRAVLERRERLERAADDFHVGNLYLNRKCTGALVGVHPFGGFNMSGTDSKAGGPDYLLLFTQAKSIAEKAEAAARAGRGIGA